MNKEESIRLLTEIQDIGRITAKKLHKEGYYSYKEIIKSTPMELKNNCNMNVTNATLAISAVSEELSGICTNCGSEDCFKAANQVVGIGIGTDSELYCTECSQHGKFEDMVK